MAQVTDAATAIPAAVPASSETVQGKVELATAAETTTGTDATRAVHPQGLKVELDKKAPLASPAFTGTPTGITKAHVGLGNVDNTADTAKPVSTAQAAADAAVQATAVNRANHTGTQSADTITDGTTNKAYTAAEKTKLAGIATAATANATDASLRDRTTHTGTQTASTISDFNTAADARVNALVPASSETESGKVELATGLETKTGTDNTRAVHPAGLKSATDLLYDKVAFRGNDLITNGNAALGTNYNFSTFTLIQGDQPPGTHGSFYGNFEGVVGQSKTLDEFISIDLAKSYKMSTWARQVNVGVNGSIFLGLAPLDVDKLSIQPYHYMEQANTRTTLAADLVAGQTTMQLTSSANWHNGANVVQRGIIFWNYVDGKGKLWAPGTYSRNVKICGTPQAYSAGAIVGNTVTLDTAHSGATIPAGTPVGNGSSGGSYMYAPGIAQVPVPITGAWTQFVQTTPFAGAHTNITTPANTAFPQATAFAFPVLLMNYSVTGGNSKIYFAGVSLTDAYQPYPATETVSGIVELATAVETQGLTDATRAVTPASLLAAVTTGATPNRLMRRDAAGRSQVVDPAAAADIATKNYVDGLAIPKTLVDAKGDLLVGSANDTPTRLAVGANDQVLTADSTQAGGMKWAAAAAAGTGGTGTVYGLPGTSVVGKDDLNHTIGKVIIAPIEFPVNATVVGLASSFNNLTGSGGLLRCGLYGRSGDRRTVGSFVTALGNVPVSNSDLVTLGSLSVSVAAGRYWLAWWMDGQGTLTAVNTSSLRIPNTLFGTIDFGRAVTLYGTSLLSTGASWPSTLTVSEENPEVQDTQRVPVALKWSEP
jgi:hypothetical protein